MSLCRQLGRPSSAGEVVVVTATDESVTSTSLGGDEVVVESSDEVVGLLSAAVGVGGSASSAPPHDAKRTAVMTTMPQRELRIVIALKLTLTRLFFGLGARRILRRWYPSPELS